MKKSFYILLVYLGCQFVLYALFLLIYALFAPDHKIHYELFGQQPEAMGYYLLATDVILYLALRKLRLIRTPLWPAASRGHMGHCRGAALFHRHLIRRQPAPTAGQRHDRPVRTND